MKLYVIAGHGAGDPGACANGYQEAERVRVLASKLKELGGDSVVVLDTSRNWYADAGINSLSIASSDCLIELHLDSASASARGGHVIIHGSFNADKYDTALAQFISSYFPGRSVTISKRTDLANPSRAKSRGINYRLLECCFISNAEDIKKFNANLDAVATGILGAFGIAVAKKEEPKPVETPKEEPKAEEPKHDCKCEENAEAIKAVKAEVETVKADVEDIKKNFIQKLIAEIVRRLSKE